MAPIPTYRGHWDGAPGSSNVDTAPIPVTAGELLIVTVMADGVSSGATAPTVWTTGPDWGFSVRADSFEWSSSEGAYAGIFGSRAEITASPVVHVTTAGPNAGKRRPSVDVWTVAGDYPGGAPNWSVIQAVGTSGSGNPLVRAFRSTAGGDGDTLAIIAGADVMKLGAPWIIAQGQVFGEGPGTDQSGSTGTSGFSTAAVWSTPDTYYSITVDPPGGAFSVYALAYFEIRKALLPPDVNAGADASHTYGTGAFTRTAGETAYTAITSREWKIQAGPTGVGDVIGLGQTLTWSPTVGGAYTLRYTAINAVGSDYDECVITVVGVAPTVDAGADRTVEHTKGLIRTAGEISSGASAITARQWRLMSGPAGSGAPVNLAAYDGDPKRCLLPNAVAGAHVIRYTATNSTGPGYDEATITVIPLRPTVSAGPDEARGAGLFTRTATETAGDSPITARQWKIQDGPTSVGTVIGTAAALSWTPPSLGQWTLRYTATSAAGTSDPDDCVISVGVTGVRLKLGRTPEPKIAVSAAFGGDLTDPDGSSWAFTEITTDVRAASGIHLRCGRGNEASQSQPAALALVLGNRHGRYSLGGRSPYWPNVRQGTPIRIETDLGDGAGFKITYTGYADGWTPHYTPRPTAGGEGDSTVSLSASGTLRRMAQGEPPVVSPLRRGLVNSSGVVAYWPCEDEAGATLIASAFPGAPGMDFSGRLHGGSNPGLPAATPRLAQSDVFACSRPLPLISDSEWYGNVPDYSSTDIIQLRCLIDIPAAGSNDGGVILGLITTGDPGFWEIRYRTDGKMNVRAWRNFSALVLDTNPISMLPHPTIPNQSVGLDGRRGQLGLTLTRSGGEIKYVIDFIEQWATVGWVYGTGVNSAGAPVVTGSSVGKAQRVQTATDGGHMDMALGHIVVRKDSRDTNAHVRQLNAWRGEIVGERLVRLRDENGLWYVQYDPPPPYYAIVSDTMGPQPVGTVLDLFRDCETTDGGILWDGIGPGLSYTTKRYRESPNPKLTLDAAAGHVALPFEPVHDDAYRVNRAAARRRDGASAVFEDVTGPLGSGIVGRYEDSREFGVYADTALPQYAGWMVGQGTAEGARYPRLSLDLVAHPELLDEWLSIIPGDRVDVLNLSAIHPSAPTEEISLVVEGYEQTIYPTRWTATMNTSLAQRWAVASVAAETIGGAGETRPEYVARVDTDASVIAALTPAGQQTLDVIVNAGPLWTTNTHATTGDYPLYLDVGAVRVKATSCTAGGVAGNASRQTFTIDPMPVTRPAGVAVRLWNPPVYGL